MKLEISRKDLKRQTYHCGGPGGQNVNKTETGVRWTYLPLNITAKSCQERTQGKNEKIALTLLVCKVYDHYNKKENTRKENAAFGGEKIRSYIMDGQRRIVDHRSDTTYYNVEEILAGNIDELLRSYNESVL